MRQYRYEIMKRHIQTWFGSVDMKLKLMDIEMDEENFGRVGERQDAIRGFSQRKKIESR